MARLRPLAALAGDDLRLILAQARLHVLPHGHVLYRPGQPPRDLFILVDGHVEIALDQDGRPCVAELAHAGALLGETALLGTGDAPPLSARVVTGATLLAIPAAPLLATLEQRFDLLLHLLALFSQRLRALVRRIADLKLMTTTQRLGSFLASQTDVTEGAADIRLPYDKKVVAEDLGMTPESLSRALAKLAGLGVESDGSNRIGVADMARLRQFCLLEEEDGGNRR